MANKLFTGPTLALSAAGLALNVALVWLTGLLGIPLYLDCIGTVIVAALGGFLPGITVGFLSNCITALVAASPDPMTLFYGFLNVLIAVAAAWLSGKGLLLKWYGWALALVAFSAIGGALGSMVTWVLASNSFGQGVSAPLASLFFSSWGFEEFSAQFTAAVSIDIVDKAITVVAAAATLYLLPQKVLDRLPLGFVYCSRTRLPLPAELHEKGIEQLREERLFRKRSIRTKITALIVVSAAVLGIVALAISITIYRGKLIEQYTDICSNAVTMMLPKIDGDQIDSYLANGAAVPGYAEAEDELYEILDSSNDLKFMYVYRIAPDGCHVVFDLDTEELDGEPTGTVLAFDESFPYLEETLAGVANIPAFITDDTYGWLLTVYKPVFTSHGEVAAYAAADIDMQDIKTNLYSFCISIASLLFGMMIVITAFSLWYCDRKLLDPMGVLVKQARGFAFDGGQVGSRVRDRHTVETGDELEEVFSAMCRTEDAIAQRVTELNAKNHEISQMQRNIIYTLANMVEDRDGNTGGHVKRTAAYVQLVGKRLQEQGAYAETVSDEYVKMLFDSAPLHDIGKIKVPDAVLNKPGKLTTGEFELMKKHTTDGGIILRSSLSNIEDGTWLSLAIDMAECHHERWDGNGYPKGLSGEGIPLCARIMAVSDVFDALVSQRSYKEPFPFEESLRIIHDGAGTQFDPLVVEAFESVAEEVRAVQQSNQG